MSRPYQFSDPDNVSSPLDRRPEQAFPPGQPPSFKQNVNRAKTKKWIEAKSYSYEGDDWGDYDEDDEYGVASQPPPVPTGMRSVTGPAGPSAAYQVPRKAPSFDRGDERRAFSTGAPTTLPHPSESARQVSNTSFAPSHTTDVSSMDPRHRADYSPTAEPAPLQSRVAPTSAPAKEKPLPIVPPTALATEPIEMEDTSPIGPPIIRPADIYARMQAEREKERATPPIHEEQLHPTIYDSSAEATPLDDDEDYEAPGLTETALSNADRPRTKRIDSTPPQLNIASFGGDSPWGGDDFWGSSGNKSARGSVSAAAQQPTGPIASQAPAPVSRAPLPPSGLQQSSTLQHAPSNGMRTMVGRAFEEPVRSSTGVHKQDSTRSNATDSTLSQSETEGSSDISPIMSRVEPTTSMHDTIPVHIPAERSHHDAAGSNRLSDATLRGTHFEDHVPPRAPFASDERRRSLSTSPARSPARSPVVAPPSRLSRSEAAQVATTSPTVPSPTDPAMREADLAAAAKTLPLAAAPAIAASEHEAQQPFLDKQPSLPSERSPRISRAESPTKGRVADLTNRFSADGRRGSQDSHRSSASFDRGAIPTLSTSPTRSTAAAGSSLQAASSGITTGRDGSLRPKMPGGWESFATTTTEAPSERPFETSHETILDDYEDDAATPIAPAPALHRPGAHSAIPETPAFTPAATAAGPQQSGFFRGVHSPAASEVDLAPTTERHQLPAREVRRTPPPTDHSIGAIAALTAAGAGLAGAFGHNDGDYQRKRWEQGDVMQRPYYNRFDSDMTETTAADTMPPTPLARENPMESRSINPNVTSNTALRVNPLASTSTARGMPPPTAAPAAAPGNEHYNEAVSVVAPAAAALSAAALAHHEHQSHNTATTGLRSPTSPIVSHNADEAASLPTRSRAAPVVQTLNATRASHEQSSSPTFAKTMAPVSPMAASSSHVENERLLDLPTVKAAAAAAPVLAAGSANSGHGVTSDHPSNAPLAAINPAGSALADSHQHGRMSPTRPPVISQMSTDESPTDLESDRLRKEIVRSLDPIDSPRVAHQPALTTSGTHLDGHESSATRPFSVIPKEYDYYFSDTEETPEVPEIPAARTSVEVTPTKASKMTTGHHSVPVVAEPHRVSPLSPATAAVDPEDRAPSSLGRRFSWEDESEKQSLVSPVSPPQEPHPIPAGLAPVSSSPSIAAPTSTAKTATSPTTTAPVAKSMLDTRSIADHPRLSGEGLHVINVNSNDLHELPDTPIDHKNSPIAALAPVSPVISEPRAASINSATGHTTTHDTVAPITTTATANPLSTTTTNHPTTHPVSKTLPYEPQLPSFREIMTIKSPEQRISTMIDTRKKWSTHDTGLSGWLSRTIEANPAHAGLRSSLNNTQNTAGGDFANSPTTRHRTTPSASLGRVFSRTSMDGSTRVNSATASPSPAGAGGYQRASGASGTSSAQLKGKELLDRAGVLGGKGMSGAKGLFAKAKARARGSGGADRGDD